MDLTNVAFPTGDQVRIPVVIAKTENFQVLHPRMPPATLLLHGTDTMKFLTECRGAVFQMVNIHGRKQFTFFALSHFIVFLLSVAVLCWF